MNTQHSLEAALVSAHYRKNNKVHQVFFQIELLIWAFILLSVGAKYAAWKFASEMLILSTSALLLSYVLLPCLTFGSKGWRQHMGSYGVGFVFNYAVWAVLFHLLHWAMATEIAIIAFQACVALGILVAILVLHKPARWHESTFYKHIVVRLILGAVFTAGPFFQVFFR